LRSQELSRIAGFFNTRRPKLLFCGVSAQASGREDLFSTRGVQFFPDLNAD